MSQNILLTLSIVNFLGLLYLLYLILTKYRHLSPENKEGVQISEGIEKIKLVRFNPFDDVGGDQSFILSILDKNNSGAIITSLHNRDITRIYAKPIKEGVGENITLSKEEKSAIVKTIKN